MVRIWVASLHQKIQCRDTLDFCFTQNLKFRLQGWIRTASTRRIVRRGKKPLRGFFRCAACEEPTPTKNSSIRTRVLEFLFYLEFSKGYLRVNSNSIGPPNNPAGEKPLRGFFRCAARAIHPHPPKRGCCACDGLYFCTNRRKNQTVSISKTKACATNFLEKQKFSMDL